MTPDDMKAIREFNRNVTWLKTRAMKKPVFLTANQLTKKTGWDKEMLRRKRDRNEIVFEKAPTGGYRYQDLEAPILG